MSEPRLSALMANYNHARYLPDAIEAIATQSRPPDEFIIVDDGSTDESVAIIERYALRYPFIRLVRNERNQGVIYTANRALRESSGEYVYWAAADDRVLPGFFEKSMSALLRYPEASLCCSLPVYFTDDVRALRLNRHCYLGTGTEYLVPNVLEQAIRRHLNITGHTSVVRRSAMEHAGGFLPGLRWHCDWFALYVIAAREGICHIPESLAAIRLAAGTYSTAAHRWVEQRQVVEEMLRLLEDPRYQDVAPFFRRSGILAGPQGVLGVPGVVIASLLRPRRWKYLTFTVFRHTARSVAVRAKMLLSRLVYAFYARTRLIRQGRST